MKILFDHNVPVYLLSLFSEHEATTAFREGWQDLVNGSLLAVAEEAGIDLLITLDIGFRHQQNLAKRSLAVAILQPSSQDRAAMQSVARALAAQIVTIEPGEVLVISNKG